MPGIPRSPKFWLFAVGMWFAVLWLLSSFSTGPQSAPEIPHIDKIAHFGYFFGGGGLFAAYLFRRRPDAPDWRKIIGFTLLFFAIVGALDEWHQTFIQGRAGQPTDVAIDTVGATIALALLAAQWRGARTPSEEPTP